MPELTYLIGEPGSGKSTLAAHLTRDVPFNEGTWPFAHRAYRGGVFELGKRRRDFPGTDALSMSVQPVVLRWLKDYLPPLVFGEGDRLGNKSFLAAAAGLGYNVHVYVLEGEEAAAMGRELRGSRQDAKWVQGRQTKVRNVAEATNAVRLEAGAPLAWLEKMLLATGDPVVAALRGRT